MDPGLKYLKEYKADVVVDAILAKKNLGTTIDAAEFVIGVGPGFTAGKDCHVVVETMRGHNLGKVIHEGCAIPNTGIPADILLKGSFVHQQTDFMSLWLKSVIMWKKIRLLLIAVENLSER